MPLLIVAGILIGAYFAGKALRPKVLSLDAQEALAPAPDTTEGTQDDLTPSDINNSFIILDMPETDGAAPSIVWNWQTPDPSQPGHQYDSPRHKKKQASHKQEGGMILMHLGTANIQNFPDMTREHVEEDARAVGNHCTIWGGQEIEPGEDTRVILGALRGLNQMWDVMGGNAETPIYYRVDLYEQVDPFVIPIHRDGSLREGAFRTNTAITSTAFQSKVRPHLPEFAVVNAHLINKGYNGGPMPRKADIRAQWREEYRQYGGAIRYHHKKGRTVFFVGDFNRVLPPPPVRGAKFLTASVSIDHIGIMPNGKGVQFKNTGNPVGSRIKLHSDHDLRYVSGRLVAG